MIDIDSIIVEPKKNYIFLAYQDIDTLVNEAHSLINLGYLPSGSITYEKDMVLCWMQAMYKPNRKHLANPKSNKMRDPGTLPKKAKTSPVGYGPLGKHENQNHKRRGRGVSAKD